MTHLNLRPDIVQGLVAACAQAGVRPPTAGSSLTGILAWTPDLTASEQATVDSLVKLVVGATLVTKAERDNIEPQLGTLRTFQQLSQNDFIALAQNARDRQLFDVTTALIRVIRALLRD